MNICEATKKSLEREQTTIRLPKELKVQLQREADKKGYTITDLIKFILKNRLNTIVQE